MAMPPLFELLPALHRLRDAAQGDQLRALLAVIGREVQLVEDDIARLYDNWFIETCDEWVVPYIADLLGVNGLAGLPASDAPAAFSRRGYVANTLAYRRRKGTAAVLEQLATDLTGWRCKAVEFFELTASAQHSNHPRPAHLFTADIRGTYTNQYFGTPFDRSSHLAEVRHIDNRRGRHNAPHVGLFLWRVQSYLLEGVTARAVDALRFRLDPLGRDVPLFNVPRTDAGLADSAGPLDVPMPISRYTLNQDLADYYGDATSAASLRLFADRTVRPATAVCAGYLNDAGAEWAHSAPAGMAVVDPELGRVAFDVAPAGPVTSSHAYGFGGDLGGGPYDRRTSVEEALTSGVGWQMGVFHTPPPDQSSIVATLAEAVTAWNQQPAGAQGVIAIMDSRSRAEDLETAARRIRIPEGSQLLIVAAGWPSELVDGMPTWRAGQLAPSSIRPHLRGAIQVVGTAPSGSARPGRLVVNGLLFEGTLAVQAGNLGGLELTHCTLPPGAATLTIGANPNLDVAITRTVCDTVNVGTNARSLHLRDSIAQGNVTAPDLDIEAATVFGTTSARAVQASNAILVGKVTIERRQEGCVRYSYLPIDSETPRRYHCQPADPADAGRVRPLFASEQHGDPDYALLADACPAEIVTGASDEGEMGAWHFVQAPLRRRSLQAALDEYLRFGLEAGVFIVSTSKPRDSQAETSIAAPRQARRSPPTRTTGKRAASARKMTRTTRTTRKTAATTRKSTTTAKPAAPRARRSSRPSRRTR